MHLFTARCLLSKFNPFCFVFCYFGGFCLGVPHFGCVMASQHIRTRVVCASEDERVGTQEMHISAPPKTHKNVLEDIHRDDRDSCDPSTLHEVSSAFLANLFGLSVLSRQSKAKRMLLGTSLYEVSYLQTAATRCSSRMTFRSVPRTCLRPAQKWPPIPTTKPVPRMQTSLV